MKTFHVHVQADFVLQNMQSDDATEALAEAENYIRDVLETSAQAVVKTITSDTAKES